MGKINDEPKFTVYANKRWNELSRDEKWKYAVKDRETKNIKKEEKKEPLNPHHPLIPLNTWSCDHFYIEEFIDKITIKRLTGQDIKFAGNFPHGKNGIEKIGNGLYIFYDMKDWCLKIYDDYRRVAFVNN
jgi:hypothetical protein